MWPRKIRFTFINWATPWIYTSHITEVCNISRVEQNTVKTHVLLPLFCLSCCTFCGPSSPPAHSVLSHTASAFLCSLSSFTGKCPRCCHPCTRQKIRRHMEALFSKLWSRVTTSTVKKTNMLKARRYCTRLCPCSGELWCPQRKAITI